ncbi:cytochrome P450 [Sparassis latifolia]
MGYLSSIVLLGAVALLYRLYRIYTRVSIADIPGPESQSFLLGNFPELFQTQAGAIDFDWQSRFGGIARIKAPLGEDYLWISDPKALQYIYHTSGYNFPKQPERRTLSYLTSDHGLTWADGERHRRQRKVMLPAFGTPESKALLPIFSHYAEQISLKWKDLLLSLPEQACTLNVSAQITPATLDSIGEAAFDYKFGLLNDGNNELGLAYKNLAATIFSSPTKAHLFLSNLGHYIPMPVQEAIYNYLPGRGLDKARHNRAIAHKVANELLEMKTEALNLGKGSRDVMSILVKANASENEKARLDHEEMVSQMRTIMLAGQETTSNTLSFAFLELARHPDMQTRLREEIRAKERVVHERGDSDFTVPDMEAMPYLQAVLREVLRFHPVVPHNYRQSAKDDVIPLSKPITTLSGKVIDKVPIPKGMRVVLSIAAYNRDTDVWGKDAHVFNPERWLEVYGKRGPSVGVVSNILTFGGGIRGCIGWRFALYELQAFLIELISNFEFALTDDIKRLRRENSLLMVPTLEGEVEKGVQMPLRVSLAARD